jgi:ribosomal protein L44E
MEVKCFCPYCAKSFTIEVDAPEAAKAPKGKKSFSEEERAKRAERMRQMRLNGIGGRPKGVKETKHRSTFGKARTAREQDPNMEWVDHAEGQQD